LLAAHFIAWTSGSRLTSAVNGSLLVNLAPAVMPFTMWLMNRERINRGEILGTAISMLGVLLLVGANYKFAPENLAGDFMCFIAMVLFCFYIALGRRCGMSRNLWLYVVPLYAITGVLCLAVALILRTPFVDPTRPAVSMAQNVVMLICLGLIPTVIGHSSMNWCIKHMRGQIVSTVNLAQFIFAGVLAYLFLNGELPDPWFYPASVLIIIGSVLVIRAHRATEVATIDPES
jgi:drug/metabolite transporter (DMT)-like permease